MVGYVVDLTNDVGYLLLFTMMKNQDVGLRCSNGEAGGDGPTQRLRSHSLTQQPFGGRKTQATLVQERQLKGRRISRKL